MRDEGRVTRSIFGLFVGIFCGIFYAIEFGGDDEGRVFSRLEGLGGVFLDLLTFCFFLLVVEFSMSWKYSE